MLWDNKITEDDKHKMFFDFEKWGYPQFVIWELDLCVLIIFNIFILVELNNKINIMEINLKYAIADEWKASKKFRSYSNKYYI